MKIKIKQKYKNLFWQIWGIVISIKLILNETIFWKVFGIISIIILFAGIIFTIFIPESSQPIIKRN